ncbi:MAG TPA: ATP-binding cassette domain-containing protein [Iamia sp.]|nr:ATP-binding cassette domain-containing protein [Iamia sp.]
MEKLLNLIVSGAVSGAIYSLVAAGLVVSYSATGIFNLGYGAVAFTTAYVYYQLHIGLGWPIVPAAVAAIVVFAPLVGVALDRLVFRRLAAAGDTAKVMATVGVLVALPAVPRLLVEWLTETAGWDLPSGTKVFLTPGIGPSPKESWRLPGGIVLDSNQLIVAVLALVVSVALWALMRHTRLGLRMRAVVDRPELAALRGVDPGRSSTIAWVLGSGLAGLAGVAGAPVFNSLSPSTYTSITFVATAAAVVGRLRSVPLAVAGGLALGVLQNLVTGYASITKDIVGFGQAVPFVVLLGGLLLLGRDRSRRAGTVAEERSVEDHRLALSAFRRRAPWAIATVLLVVYIQLVGSDYWVGVVGRGLALALVFVSFVLLTGTGGMVSLAQAALATAAGLSAGLVIERYGVSWPVGLAVGVAVAVGIGVVVAFPALRLGGLSLTLATLALGLAGDSVLFAWPWFRNGTSGWSIPRPTLGPLDLGDDRTFALVVLGVILLVTAMLHNLERSATGRALVAVRASETAAATSGLSPVAAKLGVFALSAAIAGLGGVFLVTFDFHASDSTYTTAVGLGWLAAVVLWGIRRPGAAVIAGLSASLLPALLASGFTWPEPVPSWLGWDGTSSIYVADLLFGLGAVQMAKSPDGILAFVGGRGARRRAAGPPSAAGDPAPGGEARRVIGAPAGADRTPLLTVRGLTAGYGAVGVLHGIDLDLAPGTLTVVIGANGAGKSTLCSTLGGLVPATGGRIELDGRDVTGTAPHGRARAGLMVLPESRGAFPGLTVEDNLALWLDRAEEREQAYERFPALGARRHLLARDLSGGEQQMVTLAAACVRPPRVLVADEPTLGLAPLVVAQVVAAFEELRAEGVAVLVVEEKIGGALVAADACATLRLGEVTWAGRPADLDTARVGELHLGRVIDPEPAEPALLPPSVLPAGGLT